MPSHTDGKAAGLARIRNNQRRSRERKREYVAELERKVQECNRQGKLVCIPQLPPQPDPHHLQRENMKLRELLAFAGVEDALINAHLATEEGLPEIGNVRKQVSHCSNDTSVTSLGGLHADTSLSLTMPAKSPHMFDALDSLLPLDHGVSLMDSLDQTLSSEYLSTPTPLDPFMLLSLPNDPNLDMLDDTPLCSSSILHTGKQSSDATTLCSVAYEMIRIHNKRGVDMMDIGIRLYNGFAKGKNDSGCTVKTASLLNVLEYIKG